MVDSEGRCLVEPLGLTTSLKPPQGDDCHFGGGLGVSLAQPQGLHPLLLGTQRSPLLGHSLGPTVPVWTERTETVQCARPWIEPHPGTPEAQELKIPKPRPVSIHSFTRHIGHFLLPQIETQGQTQAGWPSRSYSSIPHALPLLNASP